MKKRLLYNNYLSISSIILIVVSLFSIDVSGYVSVSQTNIRANVETVIEACERKENILPAFEFVSSQRTFDKYKVIPKGNDILIFHNHRYGIALKSNNTNHFKSKPFFKLPLKSIPQDSKEPSALFQKA